MYCWISISHLHCRTGPQPFLQKMCYKLWFFLTILVLVWNQKMLIRGSLLQFWCFLWQWLCAYGTFCWSKINSDSMFGWLTYNLQTWITASQRYSWSGNLDALTKTWFWRIQLSLYWTSYSSGQTFIIQISSQQRKSLDVVFGSVQKFGGTVHKLRVFSWLLHRVVFQLSFNL